MVTVADEESQRGAMHRAVILFLNSPPRPALSAKQVIRLGFILFQPHCSAATDTPASKGDAEVTDTLPCSDLFQWRLILPDNRGEYELDQRR